MPANRRTNPGKMPAAGFATKVAPTGATKPHRRVLGYPWLMAPAKNPNHPTGTTLAAMVVGVALVSASAAADTLKCGRHQVTVGDSKATVLQSCGEPDLKEVVSGGQGADTVRTEQWIYDRGKRHFQALLTFEGMGLIRIEFLTRQ